MGGRGGISGINAGGAAIEKSSAKVDRLGKQLEKLARYALPGRNYNPTKASEFYNIKRRYDKAKSDYNKLIAAQRHKTSANTHHTFVNSYGEATKRYVSTSTYERAQKRLNKAVRRNMGWK